MSYQNRPLNSTLRHPSIGGSQASSGQSPMLVARINEKKAELENLKQLRDLSGGLAAQMQTLEEKLSTLSDGTEVKVPKPSTEEQDGKTEDKLATEIPLPQTLVRIPIEQQPESIDIQASTGKQTAA
ncbi:DASH complex subunit DAD2, partial [Lecanoromycetidae sp. Uapishka_2]